MEPLPNRTREDKIEWLRSQRFNPYPAKTDAAMPIEVYRRRYDTLTPGQTSPDEAVVAGRIVSMRDIKNLAFADITQEHAVLQLYLIKESLGESYDRFVQAVDRGDWVCARGNPCRTKRGELSLLVEGWTMMCKPTRGVPFGKIDKATGSMYSTVTDPEILRRWPELALATDPVAYATFKKRSRLISAIRRFYEEKGFLEAAIPVIEREYGGASARPFMTDVNALKNGESAPGGKETSLPLRISHELTLKRLCVGGVPRVYHLGPAFRNEGIDADHHPEFLLTESYAFNQDYKDVMDFFEELVARVLEDVNGTTKTRFGAHEMDFRPPWKRTTMVDSLKEHASIDVTRMSKLELMAAAARCNLDVLSREGIDELLPDGELVERVLATKSLPLNRLWGNLVAYLFEQKVEPHLIQPTIVYDHPWETTPLCKRHRDPALADRFIERFEAFAGCGVDSKRGIVGSELANAYTELNDPVDQRRRMEGQAQERTDGNEEAYPAPEEFMTSVEYGLPPLGGLGFGVDRLAMIALGHLYPPERPPRIQDVVLFPLMRPMEKTSKGN
ncbi:MAG: amino acid--tRNA ligase-related protein [Nanoarchaeota archaeon]